jgi:hypothetical protein
MGAACLCFIDFSEVSVVRRNLVSPESLPYFFRIVARFEAAAHESGLGATLNHVQNLMILRLPYHKAPSGHDHVESGGCSYGRHHFSY